MWGLLIGSITVFLTIIFSVAKSSSKREEHAKNHHKELLARKNTKLIYEQKDETGNTKEDKEADDGE